MRVLHVAVVVATAWVVVPDARGVQGTAASPPPPRAVLDKYCVGCHNQRLKTAGLALDVLDLAQVSAQAEAWEKVVRKLRTGAMPPVGRPRPDKAVADGVAAWLEVGLDRAALEHPNPGRPTLHRLNRAEYRNAIRDLLGLEIDPASKAHHCLACGASIEKARTTRRAPETLRRDGGARRDAPRAGGVRVAGAGFARIDRLECSIG